MAKFDLKTAHRDVYSGREGVIALVEVPPLKYLAIDGEGDPNTATDYTDAVTALFSLAYAIKFASKASARDFAVGPLEGLWRSDDLGAFRRREKGSWQWTMLIAQPDWIREEQLADAAESARKKRKGTPHLERVRLITLTEGLSAQVLHVGSYDDEGPILARLHDEYLPQQDLAPRGDHHEVYLGDPKRTVPEKLKTLLRQPVERIGGVRAS
ncbi:GyrI-like domain-containing protein [Naasia sp. SYSU D00057]|uniref:GyrI-like domain-containing protein n=1 Tax=Naasia sp. SYSU D00057 TaxID=2817380 RepID=UPI001B307F89|nr:GyrI-like domain-containing protein [Naasia sp. SYSU D00057]